MRSLICASALVSLLALSGCGGGDKASSASSADVTPPVSASQPTGPVTPPLKAGLPTPPKPAASYPTLTVTAAETVPPDYAVAAVQSQVQERSTTTVTVDNLTGSFAAGDTVLVIQTQDSGINGAYEFAVVQSAPVVSGSTATLVLATSAHAPLANLYSTGGLTTEDFTGDLGGGYLVYFAGRTQLVKVPIYSAIHVDAGSLTAPAWNPRTGTGGVLTLYSTGSIEIANGASIRMTGKGFLGGARQTASPWARSGESYAGIGYVTCLTAANVPSCDMSALGLGLLARMPTAPATIGSSFFGAGAYSLHGAGGGAYGSFGNAGLSSANTGVNSGTGQPIQYAANGGGLDISGPRIANLTEIFFGSGGGSTTYAGAAGGNGGGTVMLFAATSIHADGANALIDASGNPGDSVRNGLGAADASGGVDEGGGGSGGSIYLSGDTIDLTNGARVMAWGGSTTSNGGSGSYGIIRLDTHSTGNFNSNVAPFPTVLPR